MRRHDWVERLDAVIEETRSAEFEYGVIDCALFSARCVDAMTDSNWADELRAEYSSEVSALKFMTREGGMEAAVTKRLGEPKRWVYARRGDVCGMPTPIGIGLGICVGHRVAMITQKDGIAFLPLDTAQMAWSVD